MSAVPIAASTAALSHVATDPVSRTTRSVRSSTLSSSVDGITTSADRGPGTSGKDNGAGDS
jgi:hypothetical protein